MTKHTFSGEMVSITIKGEKKQAKEEKTENYHIAERSYGAFKRSLRLPARSESVDFGLFMIPMIRFNAWNFLTDATTWNSQAHEECAMLGLEWQDFLARRFNQDLALL
jgi:hypothetical protein